MELMVIILLKKELHLVKHLGRVPHLPLTSSGIIPTQPFLPQNIL
jgi:hypothetical protein